MMASSLVQVNLQFLKVLDNTNKFILGGIRHGSNAKKVYRGKSKRYGPWKVDGDIVTNGTNLARQFHLNYCPGLNVGYSGTFLYAKVPGKVIVTSEITNFDPEYELVKRLSPDHQVMARQYYHVIPKPQHVRFKLIDLN